MIDIKILTIIPARSGSKGIPNKNIIDYNGQPMIYWSIKNALDSKYFNQMKIIVSTNSVKYANIVKNISKSVEVPILRPNNISDDLSTDFELIEHMLDYLKNFEDYIPDIVIQLRPTFPSRKTEDLDNAISKFLLNRKNYNSLRSVIKIDKSHFKMYTINETLDKNYLIPVSYKYNDYNEPYNLPRQLLPQTYLHNGCIDIFNSNIVSNKKTITGINIYPFIMDETHNEDIDTIKDIKNNYVDDCDNLFTNILNEYHSNNEYYKKLINTINDNVSGRSCHHRVVVLNILQKFYKVNNYLEIGVHNGTSMSYVINQEYNKINKCIGIDLFENTIPNYFHDSLNINRTCNNLLNNNTSKSSILLIKGDSFLESTLTKLEKVLEEDKLDLFFIDGLHSYEGIENDFNNYIKYVKKNGLIVIDDYEPRYPGIITFISNNIIGNKNYKMLGVFDNNELLIQKL